jgi:hypothetical protein
MSFCGRLLRQVAIAKAIASLVKYKAGGEGLKALQTIRIYVNNALVVSMVSCTFEEATSVSDDCRETLMCRCSLRSTPTRTSTNPSVQAMTYVRCCVRSCCLHWLSSVPTDAVMFSVLRWECYRRRSVPVCQALWVV